jgi:hypothetical protein
LHPRFPKLIPLGFGAVPAIADIDLDGRNEIIVTGNYWSGVNGFFDKLWVYDLGGSNHGAVEWGQFGGGPEHRGVYPVPSAPSQINPPSEDSVFIPLIQRPASPPTPPINGIRGQVTVAGKGTPGIPLELRFFNGGSWSTISNTLSSTNGEFIFLDMPGLKENQYYYVHYQNESETPGRLSAWLTRMFTNFTRDDTVGLSDFDLLDVPLVSPANGATVSLPKTFKWTPRERTRLEMYSLVLFDPVDGDPAYLSLPFRDVDGLTLNYLPPGFSPGIPYGWTTWVVSPDGAVGIPSEARLITFRPYEKELMPDQPDDLIPMDWSKYPDLPCNIYSFLPSCNPKR